MIAHILLNKWVESISIGSTLKINHHILFPIATYIHPAIVFDHQLEQEPITNIFHVV
jgi:hypothetical protein